MRCLGTATARSSCNRKEGNPPFAEAIIKNPFEVHVTLICENCGIRCKPDVTYASFPSSYRRIVLFVECGGPKRTRVAHVQARVYEQSGLLHARPDACHARSHMRHMQPTRLMGG